MHKPDKDKDKKRSKMMVEASLELDGVEEGDIYAMLINFLMKSKNRRLIKVRVSGIAKNTRERQWTEHLLKAARCQFDKGMSELIVYLD